MLIFTRKAGQAVHIGDEIRITVKQIKGRQVRLLIEAPKNVPIYRDEIYQQIASENTRAARVKPDALKDLV